MNFPTIEEVQQASPEQIEKWYVGLNPTTQPQSLIYNRIVSRLPPIPTVYEIKIELSEKQS